MKHWLLLVGLLAMAWGGAVARAEDPTQALGLGKDSQIKAFRVPNYDELGIMTSQIFGDYAHVLPNGNIEITALRMEFYRYENEERLVEMTVTSPECLYNRRRGQIMSESDIRISREEFVVTGRGFIFNNAQQRLQILNDSKVVLKGAQKSLIKEIP